MNKTPVRALLAGKARPFANGEDSAIAKVPLDGTAQITRLGIAGDEQADTRYHGGPDKALHIYPFDHYARWRETAPTHPLLDGPGGFGENISTSGLLEDQVCIGDRFRLGSALIEISQGREPCWKQARRMEWTTLPKLMVREGRSGWYCRVIEPGSAKAGDSLELVGRTRPEWSVRRVFDLLIAGRHRGEASALRELAAMEILFPGWRQRAADLALIA